MKAWIIFVALSFVTTTALTAERPFFRIVDGDIITGQPPDAFTAESSWLDAKTVLVRIEVTNASTHVDPSSVEYLIIGDTIRVCYQEVLNPPRAPEYERPAFRHRYLEVRIPGVSKKQSWTFALREPCSER